MDETPLFPPWTNAVTAIVVVGVVLTPAVAITALMLYVRSPWHTLAGDPVLQPVQFDHRHHVADDGIDCRYCHDTVDRSPSAGIPSASLCMNCHAQVWNQSGLLQPVREAFFADRPLVFTRVHRVPDFVFFNHAIHVNKGVGCVSCHGSVDRMPLATQVAPLTMEWCLDCHRAPERFLRPKSEITNMQWKPAGDQLEIGRRLKKEYRVESRTDCYTCHR